MGKAAYKMGPEQKMGNVIAYSVFKFDHMWDLVETYSIEDNGRLLTCSCMAGYGACRHKKMIPIFKDAEEAREGLFYYYDKDKWVAMGDKL